MLPVVFRLQLLDAGRATLAAGLGGAVLVFAVLRTFGARVNAVLLAALVLGVAWAVGLAWS